MQNLLRSVCVSILGAAAKRTVKGDELRHCSVVHSKYTREVQGAQGSEAADAKVQNIIHRVLQAR